MYQGQSSQDRGGTANAHSAGSACGRLHSGQLEDEVEQEEVHTPKGSGTGYSDTHQSPSAEEKVFAAEACFWTYPEQVEVPGSHEKSGRRKRIQAKRTSLCKDPIVLADAYSKKDIFGRKRETSHSKSMCKDPILLENAHGENKVPQKTGEEKAGESLHKNSGLLEDVHGENKVPGGVGENQSRESLCGHPGPVEDDSEEANLLTAEAFCHQDPDSHQETPVPQEVHLLQILCCVSADQSQVCAALGVEKGHNGCCSRKDPSSLEDVSGTSGIPQETRSCCHHPEPFQKAAVPGLIQGTEVFCHLLPVQMEICPVQESPFGQKTKGCYHYPVLLEKLVQQEDIHNAESCGFHYPESGEKLPTEDLLSEDQVQRPAVPGEVEIRYPPKADSAAKAGRDCPRISRHDHPNSLADAGGKKIVPGDKGRRRHCSALLPWLSCQEKTAAEEGGRRRGGRH